MLSDSELCLNIGQRGVIATCLSQCAVLCSHIWSRKLGRKSQFRMRGSDSCYKDAYIYDIYIKGVQYI